MEGSTLAADGVASNPSAAILTAPVSDASAWRAADFIIDRSWIVALTEAAIGEVDAGQAVGAVLGRRHMAKHFQISNAEQVDLAEPHPGAPAPK
jgi:hypothetical protein